ncbi:MAG: restriction endonuclease [Clostridia bacterium]|nr:restriction endonuclease [Clostridia bacterium]
MARTKKQEPKQEKQEKQDKQETAVVTRAEKKDAAKNLIKEVLSIQPLKHNDLLDEAAKLYSKRYGADTDNPNDVKGRIGSVLDIMKKEGDVGIDGGVYALKARLPMPAPVEISAETPAEKPVKKTAKKSVKQAEKEEEDEAVKTEEKPAKKVVKRTAKKAEIKEEILTPPTEKEEKEKAEPLPPPPIQPIAPVVPTSPETAPEATPEKTEKPKRATRKKADEKAEETSQKKPVKKTRKTAKKAIEITPAEMEKPVEKLEEKPVEKEQEKEEKAEIKNPPAIKQKAELAQKTEVMDMSFLFGAVKPAKIEVKPQEKPAKTEEVKPVKKEENSMPKAEQKEDTKPEIKAEPKAEIKPEIKAEQKPQNQPQNQAKPRVIKAVKTTVQKPMSADEKLRDNFLKKLRSLGGDYFEYYSVYLLEKYSRKNGRRLESLKISGGDRDGGIDGEIELTDRLGFRETIYIQSKNWDPERGNERLWVVGETLLQQFIGACACKQAKDGKQHTRGIFITTSNFTPDAKRILADMADKVVGYDGNDLFETAKECQFGLVYENGNWKIDEKLLSGTKAFFNM